MLGLKSPLGAVLMAAMFCLVNPSTARADLVFSITPPPSLNIDGLNILTGEFRLQGAVAYSDPLGVITATTILDPYDSFDDVFFDATIGSTTNHSLFDAPDETEIIRMSGIFTPSNPAAAGPAQFDLYAGVFGSSQADFTIFLPLLSTDFGFQVTDMGTNPSSLADNDNRFSTTPPILSLTDPGGDRIVFDNGIDNKWYAAISPVSSSLFQGHGTVDGTPSIPEPSTVTLLGLAAIGLTALRRRQR